MLLNTSGSSSSFATKVWRGSEDAFNSISGGSFVRAPHDQRHDQRHETKWGATINLKPFFLSLNYIYGSGFPLPTANGIINSQHYSRLDAAFLFQKRFKSVKLETGISVLNILNRGNIRFNRFTSFSDEDKNYQEAMRISPMIFIAVSFRTK
jgi:hypothetical protein